jgi:hypothetical protein
MCQAEAVKKSVIDGTSSAVNYVGKTADDIRKLDKVPVISKEYNSGHLYLLCRKN